MKKFLATLCMILLGTTLIACGNQSTTTSTNGKTSKVETTKEEKKDTNDREELLDTEEEEEEEDFLDAMETGNTDPEEERELTEVTDEMDYPEEAAASLWEYRDIDMSISLEETTTFSGSWFDVDYPVAFSAYPQEPMKEYNGAVTVDTDEAWFGSPDNQVEFYIFSPMWGGDPAYMEVGMNETLSAEKVVEEDTNLGKKTTTWKTFSDNGGMYTRSLLSIKEQDGSLHKVFGISYASQEAYDYYKPAYEAFKKSLTQYAD